MENTAEMVEGEGINRVDSISDLELTSVSSTVSSIFSTDDLLSSSSSGDVSTFSSAGGSGEMLPAKAIPRVLRLKCVGRNNKGVTWGVTSVIGRRKEMEDAVKVVPGFVSCACNNVGGCTAPGSKTSDEVSPVHFFGVYDGHGGSQVAQFCEKRMHEVVAEESDREAVDAHHWRRKWEEALCRSFDRADNEFSIEAPSLEMVGSAAVVVILSGCQIIASNCGDSRAVLCRGADTIALTIDQKPDREDELLRIEGQGGKVINWNGARVLGVLAMSRAIVKNDGESALTLAKSLHMISGVYLSRMKCFNAALSKSLMGNFVQPKVLKQRMMELLMMLLLQLLGHAWHSVRSIPNMVPEFSKLYFQHFFNYNFEICSFSGDLHVNVSV